MRILDEKNNEIFDPDLMLGHLESDRLLIKHHEAVDAIEEEFHYEYTEYPNGGRERHKIIDVAAVEAVAAWDEYEDIWRYILYTEEELAQQEAQRQNSPEQRIAELEEAFELLLSGAIE